MISMFFPEEAAINMKVLFLVITFAFIVPAFGQSEKALSLLQSPVTVTVNDTAREAVIDILTIQYGFNFFYNSQLPDLRQKITLSFHKQPLEKLLAALFKNTSITYEEYNGQIILKKKELKPVKMTVSDSAHVSKRKSKRAISDSGKRTFCITCLFRRQKEDRDTVFYQSATPDSLTLSGLDSVQSGRNKRTPVKTSPSSGNIVRLPYSKINPVSPFSAGIYAAGGFSCSKIKGVSEEGKVLAAKRKEREEGTFSFSNGIFLDYSITPHFFLRSGLTFQETGVTGAFNYNEFTPYLDKAVSYKNTLQYIGLPLEAGASANLKNFSFSIHSGIILAGMTRNQTTIDHYNYYYFREVEDDGSNNSWWYDWQEDDHSDDDDQESNNDLKVITSTDNLQQKSFRKTALIYTLNITAEARASKRTSFFVSPGFRTFLSSIYTNEAPVKERPYSFSVETGVRVRF